MKLYIAWKLTGSIIKSPRPSIDMDMDPEEQQEFITVGNTPFLIWWLEDPERAKFYYDILTQLTPILGAQEAYKQTLYMCLKMMSHYFNQNLIVVTGTHITLTEAVRGAIVQMGRYIAGSAVLAKIAVGAGVLLVFLGIIWIINPKIKGTRTITWQRGRYLMRYEENLWWADLIACSMKGTDLYTRCEGIGGQLVQNIKGPRGTVPVWVTAGDSMMFNGTWIEKGWRRLVYQTISWTKLNASYIGLLQNIGEPYYRLITGYDPTWVGEVELGWRKPLEDWCVEPQREVKDVTI